MLSIIKKIYRKIFINSNTEIINITEEPYDFNKSNPLGGNGERVDITYKPNIDFSKLDMYQKSHFRRYQFATDLISIGDICGDFACGTGYGSAMLVTKASKVIGMDLNSHVITEIIERYKKTPNLAFYNDNLLNLNYENYFDCIVSFETVEHFYDHDVLTLIKLFAKALKTNGKFIFSTPYMQERSEAAEKLGFHLSFYFSEEKIAKLLAECGLEIVLYKFQNYDTHTIESSLAKKDFIICVAKKK